MSEKNLGKFEGLVLAKLDGLEERVDRVLNHLQEIENRCRSAHAAHAALSATVQSLRGRTDFLSRVIWGAVAWIVLTAAGALLAAMGMRG